MLTPSKDTALNSLPLPFHLKNLLIFFIELDKAYKFYEMKKNTIFISDLSPCLNEYLHKKNVDIVHLLKQIVFIYPDSYLFEWKRNIKNFQTELVLSMNAEVFENYF